MATTENVKYFCPGSCENVPAEEPRETGLQYFGPADVTGDETSTVPAGFDNNLSDVRTETGCQYFGGGECDEVTGWSAVPACLSWTPEDVADWIESIGFSLYRVSILSDSCLIVNTTPLKLLSPTSTIISLTQSDHRKYPVYAYSTYLRPSTPSTTTF